LGDLLSHVANSVRELSWIFVIVWNCITLSVRLGDLLLGREECGVIT
jgi:hypothetical protein